MDRGRSNSQPGLNWISAQRGSHGPRSLQLQRPETVARLHLRPGRVAAPAVPDFEIAVSNTPLTAFPGTAATFNGTLTAVNGYNNSVELSCTAGSSSPPSPCTPNPVSLTPTSTGAAFLLTAGTSAVADYSFNVQGAGSDPNNTTHVAALTLHVVNFGLTTPSPTTVTEPRGATSPPAAFQVTAQGSFNQSVTLGCSFSPAISSATCAFTPSAVVNPTSASPVNMTATVTVPAGTPI